MQRGAGPLSPGVPLPAGPRHPVDRLAFRLAPQVHLGQASFLLQLLRFLQGAGRPWSPMGPWALSGPGTMCVFGPSWETGIIPLGSQNNGPLRPGPLRSQMRAAHYV